MVFCMKILLALTFFLFSVTARGEFLKSSLYGTWRSSDGVGAACFITFHEDGKFSGSLERGFKFFTVFEGVWDLKNDEILYTYTKSGPIKLFETTGGKDKDLIVEMAPLYYVTKSKNGKVRRYERQIQEGTRQKATEGEKRGKSTTQPIATKVPR